MTQINSNINNNYNYDRQQVRFKSNEQTSQIPDVQIPDMYYMPNNKPKGFKETLKKVDMFNIIVPWFEHPLLMLGTCAGISLGVDAFDRSCNKEYSKSILGKAANFGDRIEQSKFVKSESVQGVLGGISKYWKQFKTFLKKSDVINAMVTTPSQPEWDMPKEEMKNLEYRAISRYKNLLRKFSIVPEKNSEGKEIFKPLAIGELDINADEAKQLKELYNVSSLNKIPETELTCRLTLQRAGVPEAEIKTVLSNPEPLKAMGEKLKSIQGFTEEQLERIMKDEYGSEEVAKMVKEGSYKLKNVRMCDVNKLTRIPGCSYQPFGNVTSFEEVGNRANSIIEGLGAKTKTGKAMSKFLQMVHRGFTFGGTKFGVMLFVAPLLVETMLNTKKAENKEKPGTLANGLINSVSWVFVFPIVLAGIHAYGGIQYAGMGKEKVQKYRDLIKQFNERVDAKEFSTKSAYDEAYRALKGELKTLKEVKNESLLTKVLRKISAFTKADLEKIKPFNNDTTFKNFMRKIPNFMRDAAYTPARFLVFMLVGIPLVDKLIEKCTSKVFGKPYNSEQEIEFSEKKKEQEEYAFDDLRKRLYDTQREKMNANLPQEEISDEEAAAAAAAELEALNVDKEPEKEKVSTEELSKKDTPEQAETATLNKPEEKPEVVQQKVPEEPVKQTVKQEPVEQKPANELQRRDNYTYIPSSENVLNKADTMGKYPKYVPAQTAAPITKTFDNSALDAAINRANRAEDRAIKILAGNFENL